MDGVDRCDVDDRAAFSLVTHASCRCAGAEECAADVHVEDALELDRRQVLEQKVREDSGVVHEHVEPAEAGHCRSHQLLDVRLHGDVSLDADHRTPCVGESRTRRGEPVLTPVGEHHRRPRLGEPAGAGEAEALRAAGDERDLALQVEQRRERRRAFHTHTL